MKICESTKITTQEATINIESDYIVVYPFPEVFNGISLSRKEIIEIAKTMKIKPEEIKERQYHKSGSPYDLTANKELRQKFFKNK